jgi:hypothetical protein
MKLRAKFVAAWSIGIFLAFTTLGYVLLYGSSAAPNQGRDLPRRPIHSAMAKDNGRRNLPVPMAPMASVPTQANSPAPPAKKPLRDELADLQQKAKEGDAKAAAQLYRDMLHCSRAQQLLWKNMNAQEGLAALVANGPLDDVNAEQERQQEMARFARDNDELSHLCDGVTDEDLQKLPGATLQAARLGDSDARACYIHRGPLVSPRSAVSDPSSFADYPKDAQGLIDAGMASGDWKVVIILQYAYSGTSNYLASGVTGFDPVMAYRYKRLYALGLYNDDMANSYDMQQLATARQGLSQSEIELADQWARSTFAGSFKNSGDSSQSVPSNWDACSFADPAQADANP